MSALSPVREDMHGNSLTMPRPSVAIILINYNNEHHTIECIRSLRQISYNNFSILVVDNGSMQSSIDSLCHETGIELICAGVNLGFAGANNVGIRRALAVKSKYVLFLNNDSLVNPDFLELLIVALELDKGAGAAGGTVCYHPEITKVWYGGGHFVFWRGSGYHDYLNSSFDAIRKLPPKYVTFVTGCLMLVRASVFETVGLLDDRLFMYFEDVEFSFRLINSGFILLYVPRRRIYL